jgi:hypothetical protein
MANDSSKTVYLTSYMRPEMTAASIKDILKWESLNKLVVIIDGLRSCASEQEGIWRNQTIGVAETYCKVNAKMDLWVYSSNVGITEHTMRIQGRALESGFSGIWLEEDIGLDLERYSSILEEIAIEKSNCPTLISAYSHFNHTSDITRMTKQNLFLPLWGMVFNESFYNSISRVWNDKTFDSSVVSKAINPIFPDSTYGERLYKRKVLDYWTQYSSWGFLNANRWDAVANYALWTNSVYSQTATQRYAHDLSFKDSRGMNQRLEPSPVNNHEFSAVTIDGGDFCLGCEYWGSRIHRRLTQRIAASAKYRLSAKI